MKRATTAVLILLAAAAPAAGQSRYSTLKPAPTDTSLPRQKLVTVYGTDPCPKQTDPDEIIVCSRRPDEDRYRIPQTVRTDIKPDGAFEGTNRSQLLGDASGGAGGGIGSCSTTGPGGGTGCNQAFQNQYRRARKEGEVPQSVLPQITKP